LFFKKTDAFVLVSLESKNFIGLKLQLLLFLDDNWIDVSGLNESP